jgi:hypothetical protein
MPLSRVWNDGCNEQQSKQAEANRRVSWANGDEKTDRTTTIKFAFSLAL